MAKGTSLHIGLNKVDSNHYQGFDEQLLGAVNDAIDYESIARIKKFQNRKLLIKPQDVTRANVINEIGDAASRLVSGDIFLITFSGHGGRIPDQNSDESDSFDETWCLFDGQLIDDELLAMYTKFQQGVRILVISDSCHSGTIFFAPLLASFFSSHTFHIMPKIRTREIPTGVNISVYLQNKDFYDNLLDQVKDIMPDQVVASVKLLSACQDNQRAVDGNQNGLYTDCLKKIFNGDKFKGNYAAFHTKITTEMQVPLSQINHVQTPSLLNLGIQNLTFDNQSPFSV